MKKYAIIDANNKALNFIEWDGVTEFDYGQSAGNTLVEIPPETPYGHGWYWNGSIFIEPISVPVVPESITRRQCALQLLAMGTITSQEALDMTKTASIPAAIAAIFDAQVTDGAWTPEQKILAEIDFAAIGYYRINSLLSLMGLTEEQIDQFFIAAGQL